MMSTQISIYMLQIRRLDKLDLAFFCSNQPPKDVFRKLWSPFVLSSSTLSMSSQTEWTPSSSKSTPTWTSPAPLCPFRIFRYGKDRGGGLHRGCRKEPQSFSRSVQFHLQSFVLWNETPGLSSANPFWVFISLDTGLLWIHEGGSGTAVNIHGRLTAGLPIVWLMSSFLLTFPQSAHVVFIEQQILFLFMLMLCPLYLL